MPSSSTFPGVTIIEIDTPGFNGNLTFWGDPPLEADFNLAMENLRLEACRVMGWLVDRSAEFGKVFP